MLETILTAVIIAAIPVVIGGLGAFINRWLKVKLTPAQYDELFEVSRRGVAAAEKWAENFPQFKGNKKLDYVTNVVNAAAKRLGVKNPDPDVVNAFIHSALAEIEGLSKKTDATTEQQVPVSEVQDIVNRYEYALRELEAQLERYVQPQATGGNIIDINGYPKGEGPVEHP